MEGKSSSATAAPSYVEFEPFCQWQREEGRDVLVIHLPDFKKDQLRVQINNRGTLKISGERPVDSLKKSKFYKEVEVPKYCDTNGIQAKFANASLHLIMPKLPKISTEKADKAATGTNQSDGSGVAAVDDSQKKKKSDQSTQAPAEPEKPMPAPAQDPGSISKKELTQPAADTKDVISAKPKSSAAVSRMKICAKTSLNVAVAVAVLVALVSYVLYMYRSVVLEG